MKLCPGSNVSLSFFKSLQSSWITGSPRTWKVRCWARTSPTPGQGPGGTSALTWRTILARHMEREPSQQTGPLSGLSICREAPLPRAGAPFLGSGSSNPHGR